MSNPRRVFNFRTMQMMLQAITDQVGRAADQEERGEKITACGMSNEQIADLCEDYLPNLFNPYMTAGEIKKEAHISESTLRRAISEGELESAEKAGNHAHFFKKWDVREFIKKRLKKRHTN